MTHKLRSQPKRFIILNIVFSSLAFNAISQVTFQKTFGGANALYCNSVIQTSDSGYAVTGETYSFGAGNYDIFIMKTDVNGVFQWAKTYGGADWDRGKNIIETYDGGLAVAGFTESFGAGNRDIVLLKTDNAGTLEWAKTYGGSDLAWGFWVIQTSDSGFAITSSTNSFGAGNNDVYVVKTNAAGTLEWAKTFGGTGSDYGGCIKEISGGGYIVTGYTDSYGAGLYDLYLLNLNATGSLQWSKTFGGATDDFGNSVIQTGDGGFIITGRTYSFGIGGYSNIYLLKTNSSGALQWSRSLGKMSTHTGYMVQQTPDGGFIVVGESNNMGAGVNEVYLLKFNQTGTLQWSKIYGDYQYDYGYGIELTFDGGYIVAGNTTSFGTGIANIYLLKTDANGNSGCNEQTLVPDIGYPSDVVSSGGSESSGGTENSANPTITNIVFPEDTLCYLSGINDDIVKNRGLNVIVSPNPFQSSAIIYIPFSSNGADLEEIQVYLYDIFGQVLNKNGPGTIKRENETLTYELSRNGLDYGIYFYKIKSGGKDITNGKFIIE